MGIRAHEKSEIILDTGVVAYHSLRTMKLDQLLKTTPESLAKEQHDALKAHVLATLDEFRARIDAENYKGAEMLTYNSPAGDGWGSDDTCINFSYDGTNDTADLGAVLERLKALKELSSMKKGKS